MAATAKTIDTIARPVQTTGRRKTLSNALIITRREVRDSFRDWRILAPIVILTFLFPGLAQFIAGKFTSFVTDFGAQIIGERTIPFLLMIVGFFPISISLVIALETFVGEKERRSLEPLLSTPLTNTELYIGKTLAAMIPPLVSSFGGMMVYLSSLVLGDLAWRPQPMLVAQILLLTTVQALVMVTGAVVVSSQTTSTRAANLLASFIIIPMTLIIQGESAIMFLAPDAESPNGIGALWAIIVGEIVVVILLLRVGNSVFNREEILGRTIDQINLKQTFARIGRNIRAIDEAGTPARNLAEWYRGGIVLSLRRLSPSMKVAGAVFLLALVAGFVLGQSPDWRLPTLRDPGALNDTAVLSKNLDLVRTAGARWIFIQNARILLGATVLGMFTFGTGALVLTPAVYFVLGFIFSQVAGAGFDPSFMLPAVLTHGIIEIPVILIATAAALRLGAIVTRPPKGMGVGQAWSMALGDTIKIWLGVVLPGLALAALIEAYVTPVVMRVLLGG
jgi:uncharacterized membrane protein SpoIIM required for sporulation/ABC-type transport system involved in multi-copper enzyme maturation permease subunit